MVIQVHRQREVDTCRERIYCSDLNIMTLIILHNISPSAYSKYHWFIVNTWRPCINQLSIIIFFYLYSICLFHFTKTKSIDKDVKFLGLMQCHLMQFSNARLISA